MKELKLYIFILFCSFIGTIHATDANDREFNFFESFIDCTPDTTTIYDNICEDEFPYLWNERIILTEGIYKDTLVNSLGCDSIITLILSIITLETPVFYSIPTVICQYDVPPDLPSVSTNGIEGIWYEGFFFRHTQKINTDLPGTFPYTFIPFDKCIDSLTIFIEIWYTVDVISNVTNVSQEGINDGRISIEVSGGTEPYTFYWSNGESTKDISGLSEGIYSVSITGPNTCNLYKEFEITTLTPTSSLDQSKINEIKFNIYPNLNEGIFNIKIENISINNYLLQISNTLGQIKFYKEIKTSSYIHEETIDISHLPKGNYFVKIVNPEINLTKKIILR